LVTHRRLTAHRKRYAHLRFRLICYSDFHRPAAERDTGALFAPPEAGPLENGEVAARTAFLVYRSHLETDHQLLSGCREDVLRKVNGAWKVARRTIVLDANVLLDKNLSVFL
jgi:3-phenylpropionate/cinnamic acid dioxygenase small subunit